MDSSAPSPFLFLDTLMGYQKTAMIRAAVELDLFTAIGEGACTADELALRRGVAQRGVRILCDSLVIAGFLTKSDGAYGLTPDSALFLDSRSPACFTSVMEFLLSPTIVEGYDRLTDAVRRGGTALPPGGTMAPDHPVWVQFARAMSPMAGPLGRGVAAGLDLRGVTAPRVLDIAAGHGLFGLAFAERYPEGRITAQDWESVLEVASGNASRMGFRDRLTLLPGSVFDVDLGGPYDVVLLPNFLHHFDPAVCTELLKKVFGSLSPGGCAVAVEFVSNDDRVTPPGAASFALVMLASTQSGDAYSWNEYREMFTAARFVELEQLPLPPSAETAVVGRKPTA